jgi:hypothetical protein
MSFRASVARTRLIRRASWLAVVALTVAALAVPSAVSAHTPRVSLTCEDGLRVNLTQYNNNGTNSVAVSIDGEAVDGSPFTFGGSFSETFAVDPETEAHTATVAVSAWDDPNGNRGWTRTFELSIDACVEPTPSPTPVPVEPTPTPEPEIEIVPEPTPTPTPVVTDVEPTATPKAPEPTGEVGGSTGTPAATSRATLPPTDAIDGDATTPAGDGWRLVLLLVAGALAGTLLLTPARAAVRKDDSAR